MTFWPGAPNLFVIGGIKCGSTSLHSYLGAHPDIFMGTPKEPDGLLDADEMASYLPGRPTVKYSRSRDAYERLFEGATNERCVGDSSA